ncbi:MAG TPA: DUF1801 domain-containing protein [Candidatus Sulfotelmatobacter sp.]|jgi:hypothetical protein|nr:DUF1801 domain-containing protein [Candidatus Sulfotelmatobacter sp.]
MVKSKPKTVEEVLAKSQPEQKDISERLRTIVKINLPDASEIVRRGVITYVLNDKDFVRIHPYSDHVDLELLTGREIDDEHLQGRGTGEDGRYIRIVSLKNIDEAEIIRILKEVAALT